MNSAYIQNEQQKSNCVFLINIFKIYFYIFVHHKSTNPDNQQLYKINKIIITKYIVYVHILCIYLSQKHVWVDGHGKPDTEPPMLCNESGNNKHTPVNLFIINAKALMHDILRSNEAKKFNRNFHR